MRTSLAVLCVAVTASAAFGGVTVTGVNNVADVSVDSSLLGSADDYQESSDPVVAFASLAADLGEVTARASAAPFDVSSYAVVGLLPVADGTHVGGSGASALSALFELTSDTSWRLDLLTTAVTDQSTAGQTALTGVVNVWDPDGALVYGYDFLVDGLSASQALPAGVFTVAFYTEAGAAATAGVDNAEFAEALVEITGAITVIPVPGAFVLACFGAILGIPRFRRRATA